MSSDDQGGNPDGVRNSLRVRIPLAGLAVGLSLVLGFVAGTVAYRYAPSHRRTPTPAPAEAAVPAAGEHPEVGAGAQAPVGAQKTAPETESGPTTAGRGSPSDVRPELRKVDAKFIDGAIQVTLSLNRPVTYDAHRLDHPDRVYIDLHGVRLAPELTGKAVSVTQGGLTDIRMAQTKANNVRVVLDLAMRLDHSVIQQSNPPALVVKLTPWTPNKSRPAGGKPKKTS